jgi:hypothetical protein
MTQMTETEAEQGWKRARISEILDLMRRHDLSIEDIQEPEIISPMVDITGTQTPHQPSGNTVAGQ